MEKTINQIPKGNLLCAIFIERAKEMSRNQLTQKNLNCPKCGKPHFYFDARTQLWTCPWKDCLHTQRGMTQFLYSLIRYVPTPQRMEPINIGVILQGEGIIQHKLSPVTIENCDQWMEFFDTEINSQNVPGFQPDKTSPEFLVNLAEICSNSPFCISKPMIFETFSSFQETLEKLFAELVLTPMTMYVYCNPNSTLRFMCLDKPVQASPESPWWPTGQNFYLNSDQLVGIQPKPGQCIQCEIRPIGPLKIEPDPTLFGPPLNKGEKLQ